jgi:hypothetical protein
MSFRRRRWLGVLGAAAGLGVLAMAIPAIRTPILRALGQALVADDAPAPADMIVVATGADGAGVLEAADLVHSGVGTRVAVFADPPDPIVDREFIRRGVPYDEAEKADFDAARSAWVEMVAARSPTLRSH